MILFFFFQAEDGIRDYKVTGVQTCALPIYEISVNNLPEDSASLKAMLREVLAKLESVSADQQHEKRLAERSEEHTSELQSPCNLVCRLLLEKKKKKTDTTSCQR